VLACVLARAASPCARGASLTGDECSACVRARSAAAQIFRGLSKHHSKHGIGAGVSSASSMKAVKAAPKVKERKRLSGYQLFANEKRPGVKEARPNASFGEVSTAIGQMWAAMSKDAKDAWLNKARALPSPDRAGSGTAAAAGARLPPVRPQASMEAPPPRVAGDEDSTTEDLSLPTPSSDRASEASSSPPLSAAGGVTEADEDEDVDDGTGFGSENDEDEDEDEDEDASEAEGAGLDGGSRESDGGSVGDKRKREAESDVDNGRSAPHAGSTAVYDFS
jgi:hypothetical protein